ncbi:MAG: hypothetical protein ACREF4_06130 [Gammaproteobacteria bacterium]
MHEPISPYRTETTAHRPASRGPAPSLPEARHHPNGTGAAESGPSYADAELFDCGTLLTLRRRKLQGHLRGRDIVRRACLVVLAGWVPLLILAAYQSVVLRETGISSFLADYAVACRSLIAAPLLVLAEWLALPRLKVIAYHFRESGLVSKADDARFAAAWASTLRLRDSITADAVLIALAYAATVALISAVPLAAYPPWHLSMSAGEGAYSPAGWWHALISLPLVLMLLLTWLWRLAVWGRFLFLMSRLNLRLVPAHPDRTAGLRFVAYSVQAFSLVALAIGTIAAGATANRIQNTGAPLESFWLIPVELVAGVVAVFAGPLLTFFSQLLRAWQRGTLQYSAVAASLGRQFEKKWLRAGAAVDEDALGVPDFSATTDLYQIASNVYEVRLMPISVTSLGILVGMTAIPFLVLALMLTPIDVVVSRIASLLF